MYHSNLATFGILCLRFFTVLGDGAVSNPGGGDPVSSLKSIDGGGPMATAVGAIESSSTTSVGTVFQTLTPDLNKRDPDAIRDYVKREIAKRQFSGTPNWQYQISPHILPSRLLRSFTGNVIPTFDFQDAILNGRAQVALSHGQRDEGGDRGCNSTDPIHLYSGLGNKVTILVPDIPFNGGYIHIVDYPFTVPLTLSASLASVSNASIFESYLGSNNALDFIPEITVFVPSDSAILTGLACLSGEIDVDRLLRAHVIVGFTGYSPLLVEGAQFRAQDGTLIDVTTDYTGAIFINHAKVVKSDIVIKNGVVHIIDRLLFAPTQQATPTSGPNIGGSCSTTSVSVSLLSPPPSSSKSSSRAPPPPTSSPSSSKSSQSTPKSSTPQTLPPPSSTSQSSTSQSSTLKSSPSCSSTSHSSTSQSSTSQSSTLKSSTSCSSTSHSSTSQSSTSQSSTSKSSTSYSSTTQSSTSQSSTPCSSTPQSWTPYPTSPCSTLHSWTSVYSHLSLHTVSSSPPFQYSPPPHPYSPGSPPNEPYSHPPPQPSQPWGPSQNSAPNPPKASQSGW